MHIDTHAEILGRKVLRDLVALSAIPAVWVGRDPPAVAAGLADTLVGMLELDFAFVRLSDPSGAGAVDVTRGDAWKRFPEWLEGHRAKSRRLSGREIVPDVGGGAEPCRGVVIPIGVNADGGLVAAACDRSDFPTEADQLLLSLAANHAATAFQSARLINERTRAEEKLRTARNELEAKVAERTADLRRSEAYLTEAQKLTHTGSFAIDVATREVAHSSDEHSRLYGFDPEHGVPSLEGFVERIQPQDRAKCIEALEKGIREATTIDVEYRVVLPQSPVRRHRAIAHPIFTSSGEVDEFVGTIVDVTERRETETELERLAGEQTALRRVATLVAREASQAEVFTAIAEGIAQLFGTEEIRMLRFERDASAVVVAGSGDIEGVFAVGSRQPLGGENAASRVFRTGRPERIDDYRRASGPIAEAVRPIGIRCVVATPILVEGRLWGAMVTATTRDEPLPPETESRLVQFTELMATAIANTESHAKANRLTEAQAALRRVATLVAQGVRPVEIFSAVSEEIGRLFGSNLAAVTRFDADGPAQVVVGLAESFEEITVGSRWDLDDAMATAEVYRTRRSARVDGVNWSELSGPIAAAGSRLGAVSTVASPIVVEGGLWGAMTVSAKERLPVDAEERLEKFTGLVATAIANANARAEVERLAEEQAVLRRVAMLVAQGASPTAVFDAVAGEMEGLLDADGVTVSRYEPGDEVTLLAHHGSKASRVPPGTRVRPEAESVTATVRRTERPARMEHYEGIHGAIAQLVQTLGVNAAVGAPIVVEGRLWGVIIATWNGEASPPADTEERMAQFAQLLDTAIANADSRDQLTASRARLLTEGDEARRRVVRDLHDGAQQRLVHAIITLKLARRAFRNNDGNAESLLGEALEHAQRGNAELRELAHGILPDVLTHGGLRAGVEAVVSRLDLPVQVDVPARRFPAEIEASAYFFVAEALTNVVKHAGAGHAEVRASVQDGALHVAVRDDGIGGADPNGHGLVGIGDRVTALGGRLTIESPAGGGTLVAATLQLPGG
jgi:signal transduction histidine kinase/PAS domain-containing protein